MNAAAYTGEDLEIMQRPVKACLNCARLCTENRVGPFEHKGVYLIKHTNKFILLIHIYFL
jgi:hypothetical protein